MEAWTEVNLAPVRERDEGLLELIDVLVHEHLAGRVQTWFFFWEPDLRLRIRWHNVEERDAHRPLLAAQLDEWKSRRWIKDWYEGAHGARDKVYVGEAEHYGAEIWQRLQLDWMNGSELALELIRLDRAKLLVHSREYYWQRHVHLFTNQLLQTWEAEIEQCLRQALGYLRARGKATRRAKELLGELEEYL